MTRRSALRALLGLPMVAMLPTSTVTYQMRKNGAAVGPIVALDLDRLRVTLASEQFQTAFARVIAQNMGR